MKELQESGEREAFVPGIKVLAEEAVLVRPLIHGAIEAPIPVPIEKSKDALKQPRALLSEVQIRIRVRGSGRLP
eukprot:15462189-Alexandrium_andersonii.AAC.2